MTNNKEQHPNEKQQPKERKQRKRGKRAHGTSSIFRSPERKGKQWVAQIALEYGKTRQRYFNTEGEAADALKEMLYELRHATFITEKDQTVKQHFERWLAVHKTKIRHSTYLTYCSAVNKYILSAFGHLTLQRLRAQDLDAFYARKVEEGLSSSRIGAIHTVISMALQHAVRWRLVARNVSEDVSPPITPTPVKCAHCRQSRPKSSSTLPRDIV